MAYIPDPTDVTQPTEDKFAKTAAAEFRALKAYIATIVSGGGPGAQTPGMIADFAFATAPPGWIEADGSLKSRVTFAPLWDLVSSLGPIVSDAVWASGNNYGSYSDGDGVTTFRVPDFRSMVRKARDGGRGFGSLVQGKFEAPGSDHVHKTAMGWDSVTGYLWLDGAGNPLYGSDVDGGASLATFSRSAASSGNVRTARTAGPLPTGSDWNRVASNGVLTCIKT